MQVSHSRIDCYKQCAYKYKLRYKDKLETYFNNDPAHPLIIGTALHTGIEKDVQTAINEYYSNYPVINDQNVEEAIKLEYVIKKCRAVLPDGLHEVKIECPEFIGYIDLLVPVGKDEDGQEWFDLYDFKYSNNTKNYMNSGQLHEYKFYFERTNPTKHIRAMYFLFAPKVAIRMKRKNKTNPRDETIEEFRKRLRLELENKEPQLIEIPYDIDKVKEFLKNANECRMATQFPKQESRFCDYCEYQKYCESNEKETLEIMNLPKNERRSVQANTKKKIWLYGAPFSGKTYLANQFPDPLMANTDGNIKYVDAPYVPIKDEVKLEGRITKRTYAWDKFTDLIDELEKGQNDFQTIVVDLLEDVNDYCRVKVCADRGWEHESDDSFKAYDIVRSEFLRNLKRLLNLDYNIILISHEDTSRDITKKTGDKITAIKPNINDKLANKIAGMVDIVARVINNDGNRILSFKTNEVIFGGGRLTLPVTEIPCDYGELCKIYDIANKGKAKTVEVKAEDVTAIKEDGTETPLTEVIPETEGETVSVEVNSEVETADVPPRRKRREKPVENTENAEIEGQMTMEELETEKPAEEAPRRRRRRAE